MKEIEEPVEFGVNNSWRLLQRHVEDGVQRITRCLPIRGRGVLMQTQTREVDVVNPGCFVPGTLVTSEPYEVKDVIVVEWAETRGSSIEVAPGVPASQTIVINHRELMGCQEAKAQFYEEGVKEKNLPTHRKVVAGAVFTLDVTAAQKAQKNAA